MLYKHKYALIISIAIILISFELIIRDGHDISAYSKQTSEVILFPGLIISFWTISVHAGQVPLFFTSTILNIIIYTLVIFGIRKMFLHARQSP